MARTNYAQGRDATPGLLNLDVQIVVGAAGVAVFYRGLCLKDSSPPAQSATGQFTITLDRAYRSIVTFMGSMLQQAGESLEVVLVQDNVAANPPTLVVETRNGSGVATNPASGDKVYMHVRLDELGLQF